jgi:predicted N-formylglutamate amidohydrolase
MGIWDISNTIEEYAYDVGNIKNLIEIIATDIQDPHSGALWATRLMLDRMEELLLKQSAELMVLHREQKETSKKKKK